MVYSNENLVCIIVIRAGSEGWAIVLIAPPKTYESNFIHHKFVQFRKQRL